jgi:adenosine deaminase CECR1
VGQEDAGRPLKDMLPELFWFRKQCAQEKVEIPFFFHAGECLGDGSDTDQNLFDAVLLGTRRIGHGFSLYKHPLLIDMVKEKKILIESCPISNEVLRLCASVMSHPLPALLARGVSCSLCNDDPAILGQDTAGMTHDFWQALQGWDNLGLAGLGSLAENSVRWAAFEDQDSAAWVRDIKDATLGSGVRAERMKQWSIEWEQFCLWIVTEFGDEGESIQEIQKGTNLIEL